MKKMNPLTLSFLLSITVGVALAGYIATRPLAGEGTEQGTRTASSMLVPF